MNNILESNIKCDYCDKEFILEAQDIKTKKIDDVEVSYFECNHCNNKYVTTCIDDYIRKEQRRYKKLIKSIDKVDKTQKCLRNMKLHSDRLKDKIIDKL